ncbi:hypothetical protein ACHAWF_012623 [Thalassiosira exigua]
MGTKSKSSKSKKKGPKGKKARAKAKLDQVWGESVDEEARKASRVRVGKSRSLPAPAKGGNGARDHERDVDPLSNRKRRGEKSSFDKFLERREGQGRGDGASAAGGRRFRRRTRGRTEEGEASSSEEDGSDSEADDEANGGSLATLLRRISGPKKASRSTAVDGSDESDHDDDDDDEDVDSDPDGSGSEGRSGGEISPASEGDDDAETRRPDDAPTSAEDPYDAHFSKPPLPASDSASPAPVLRKVPATALIDASVDLRMCGPLLDAWESTSSDASKADGMARDGRPSGGSRKAWEAFASGPHRHVRKALTRNWGRVNRSARRRSGGGGGKGGDFSPLQLALYPAVARYADVLVTTETRRNRPEIHNLLAMHALNHVLTSRTRVQRHNRRIKELTNSSENADEIPLDAEGGGDKWRDQGYARPKVLVLLPTRGTCWTFIKLMIELLGDAAIVDHEERFGEEYGPIEPGGGDGDDNDDDAKAKEARRAAVLKQKGPEWNELFGDKVNADDDFVLGMSVTPNVVKSAGKKRSKHHGGAMGSSGVNLKLFADFYRSDIILASPVGLKMAITKNDNDDGEEGEGESDVDFLSSVDVCFVLQSDVLLMQNIDHANAVLESLNQQPTKVADVDFSRVRNYFLEGQAARWRQLIVVSQFADPYVMSAFRRHAKNVEGRMTIRQKVPADDASICSVAVRRLRQVFQRVACQTASKAGTERLRYFADHILPKLLRSKQTRTLIYIPSYFDFVAVRNLLLKREASFVSVSEYARVSEVSRGRARFAQGRKAMLLYTGRAHYFLRHRIQGARHAIFFGLPERAEFYPAVVNMLNDGSASAFDADDDVSRMPTSCLSLFTKFDSLALERVVGTSHAERMVKGEKSSYLFCS